MENKTEQVTENVQQTTQQKVSVETTTTDKLDIFKREQSSGITLDQMINEINENGFKNIDEDYVDKLVVSDANYGCEAYKEMCKKSDDSFKRIVKFFVSRK